MYERCANGKQYNESNSEDLYDSDDYKTDEEDSFEILPEAEQNPKISLSSSETSLDSWLDNLDYLKPTWEEVKRVKEKIKNSAFTALKGIPGPIEEPDKEESSIPIARSILLPPRVMEEFQRQGGG